MNAPRFGFAGGRVGMNAPRLGFAGGKFNQPARSKLVISVAAIVLLSATAGSEVASKIAVVRIVFFIYFSR